MLLSVQTSLVLDNFGINEGFRMIAEAGFGGVDWNLNQYLPGRQIRRHECSGFYDQTDEELLAFCEPYKAAAEKYGIRFVQAHAPFPSYVRDEKTDAYVLEAIKKTIMMCGYVGCPNIVVHPAYMKYDRKLTREEDWENCLRLYTGLIPALKKYNVCCCLENMASAYCGKEMHVAGADPYEAVRYVDALNEIAGEKLFGFCLDVGHATLLGLDAGEFALKLGERLRVLHVHDNNGIEDQHLFPYMGIIDWDGFLAGLKEIGYSGPFNFETDGAMENFDPALAPKLLSLLHATGELFMRKLEGA